MKEFSNVIVSYNNQLNELSNNKNTRNGGRTFSVNFIHHNCYLSKNLCLLLFGENAVNGRVIFSNSVTTKSWYIAGTTIDEGYEAKFNDPNIPTHTSMRVNGITRLAKKIILTWKPEIDYNRKYVFEVSETPLKCENYTFYELKLK